MKTKSLFVAAVAIMMAACSETENISVQNTAQQPETAVSFDTYTAKALTRAGAVGEIVTKEDLQVNNFGVFAYYHNGTEYYTSNKNENDYFTATEGQKEYKPDFMWNQKVEYDGDNWFYFPVKYWPNESATGTDNVDAADPTNNHATTTGAASPDKLTFFAYAPYVEATTGGAVQPNNDGITAIYNPVTVAPVPLLNTVKSDPYIAYKTPTDPLKTVDLLWGVVPAYKTKYSTVVPAAAEQDVVAGFPNYNLLKQTTDERIMFQFKHALAKLTLDVVGFFDDVPVGGANSNPGDVSDNNVAKDTKIVVEYVKLSTKKYANNSVLNLNNHQAANKPNWLQNMTDAAGTANETIDFEISGNMLANLIRYRTPSDITKGYAEQPRGVTKDAVALLANDASQEAFFGIIPQVITGEDATLWTAEIKYHVFTKDANLENGYSEITNVIKKEDIDMTFDPGKHYTLRLRLGMTTVKFDATVEDWIDGTTTPADLPINVAVESVSYMHLKTTPLTASGTDSYAATYTTFGPSNSAFTFDNVSTKIELTALKAKLENAPGDAVAVSVGAATLNTDVDWIGYDQAGNFVAKENRTNADRQAKIWATYGGVDSEPIILTQRGSTLEVTLAWDGGSAPTPAWDLVGGAFAFTPTIQYVNGVGTEKEAGKYIDVTTDANANGIYTHENWITVDRSAKKVSTLSKNEDEVNDRTSNITLSYGGVTSTPISITQSKKN